MSILVKITDEDIAIATDFADKRSADTALYQKRGGFKPSDIINGALAEIAVHRKFKQKFPDISEPDFKIYKKREKSFKADLSAGDKHFHVKGQSISSAVKYTASWLMQRKDPILIKTELDHFLVPTVVDPINKVVIIYGCIPFMEIIKNNAVDECSIELFRKTKVAIRLDTLTSKLPESTIWGALK